MNIYLFRLSQAIKFGWVDAAKVAQKHNASKGAVYCDILRCFFKYRLRSMQYLKEDFWALDKEERERKGMEFLQKNKQIDAWTKDCYDNRKFLNKWKDYRWDLSGARYHKRLMAYTKHYHLGEDCIVLYDVILERNHGLEGTLKIGNRVLLGKHVYIDYSGELIIHDNVSIANGVIIETHTHPLEKIRHLPIPSRLEIGESVKLLSRSYIADTCHSIGRYARIGAGSYIRTNIPPYAIVMGNPAKIIGFLYSPEEMVEFEKDKYPESERTPLDKYTQWYEKYFRNRTKEIKSFIKL